MMYWVYGSMKCYNLKIKYKLVILTVNLVSFRNVSLSISLFLEVNRIWRFVPWCILGYVLNGVGLYIVSLERANAASEVLPIATR